MTHHILKTVQPHFDDVWDGKKRYEVHKNDRIPPFAVGDEINLVEYDTATNKTGRVVCCEIEHIPPDHEGLADDFVVLGITSWCYRSKTFDLSPDYIAQASKQDAIVD